MSDATTTPFPDIVRTRDYGAAGAVLPLSIHRCRFVAVLPSAGGGEEAAPSLDFSLPANSGYLALLEDI